jgi:hypothetical protein
MREVMEETEVVPPAHVCSVHRQRLHKDRWIATCEVCGPLAKPYDEEDVAKRRAVLHAQSWGKLRASPSP